MGFSTCVHGSSRTGWRHDRHKYLDIGEEEISRLLTERIRSDENLYETKRSRARIDARGSFAFSGVR